mmetsp:Transcript_27075/g.41471  ORF Transcript_27075/g.41471 Transcript_27075/m.41471 type:complete len:236 (-) Transcript_27075:477-1184(-)
MLVGWFDLRFCDPLPDVLVDPDQNAEVVLTRKDFSNNVILIVIFFGKQLNHLFCDKQFVVGTNPETNRLSRNIIDVNVIGVLAHGLHLFYGTVWCDGIGHVDRVEAYHSLVGLEQFGRIIKLDGLGMTEPSKNSVGDKRQNIHRRKIGAIGPRCSRIVPQLGGHKDIPLDVVEDACYRRRSHGGGRDALLRGCRIVHHQASPGRVSTQEDPSTAGVMFCGHKLQNRVDVPPHLFL